MLEKFARESFEDRKFHMCSIRFLQAIHSAYKKKTTTPLFKEQIRKKKGRRFNLSELIIVALMDGMNNRTSAHTMDNGIV